jgi:hypothetical protein
VALRPGGPVRLNPLDAPDSGGDDAVRRRGELLSSLACASLGRQLLPSERTAVELAVAQVSVESASSGRAPTLPAVVEALLQPSDRAAATVRTETRTLAADGRQVALELRRLVSGDLRGMFDGETSSGIDLFGPLVVLDLSAVYHSAALGVLMTCAAAWLQAALVTATSPRGVVVVVDEAWAILANLGVARWLQSSWKLARAYGVANVAVLHRVSDLFGAGPVGSEQAGLAQGLLADSETRVVYAQAPGEVATTRELLGLSETEADLVPHLRRGVALWKVGDRSFLVRHVFAPSERALVDTDAAMTGIGSPPAMTGIGSPRRNPPMVAIRPVPGNTNRP